MTTSAITAPKLVLLEELTPAEWNPRLIKDKRFLNLCRSIARDPGLLWRRSVLAQDDENGTIYAGNMRYRAVAYLWKNGTPKPKSTDEDIDWRANAAAARIDPGTIPAIKENVSKKLAHERAIVDNANWGEYVDQDLAELLVEMSEDDTDLTTLGLEEDRLKELLSLVGVNPDPKELVGRDEDYKQRYELVIECESESQLEEIFQQMTEEGHKCRTLIL